MKGETPSYSVSADWDLKPETVFFVCTRTTPRTEVKSISTTHAKTRSISTTDTKQGQSLTTLKSDQLHSAHNQFRTPHTKGFSFEPNTKTESHSIPHKKINLISMSPLKSSQFDAHFKLKSTLMPRHKRKLSQFRPPAKKQANRSPHSEEVLSGPHTKDRKISVHALKPSEFWPANKSEVSFDPREKSVSISMPHTKPKLIFIPSLKSSQFRCPEIKTEKGSIQTLKLSHFRSPHENRVPIAIPTLKPRI